MEGSANLLLRKYGMDPVRDVIWVALGTGGRVSSLVAKTVDSAVLGFADSRTLRRAATRFTKSPTSAKRSKCFTPGSRLRKKCW